MKYTIHTWVGEYLTDVELTDEVTSARNHDSIAIMLGRIVNKVILWTSGDWYFHTVTAQKEEMPDGSVMLLVDDEDAALIKKALTV